MSGKKKWNLLRKKQDGKKKKRCEREIKLQVLIRGKILHREIQVD